MMITEKKKYLCLPKKSFEAIMLSLNWISILVEPAELFLNLAKMTLETRQTPEVLLAYDVARSVILNGN
ncbi:hypothetical protein AHAS_Ahas17G0292700 [Arachis hypogaea]